MSFSRRVTGDRACFGFSHARFDTVDQPAYNRLTVSGRRRLPEWGLNGPRSYDFTCMPVWRRSGLRSIGYTARLGSLPSACELTSVMRRRSVTHYELRNRTTMRRLQVFTSGLIASALFLGGHLASGQSQVTSSEAESRVAELVKRELLLESSHFWRSAIDVNMEILKLDPKNVHAMNIIAGLYGTLGDFQEEIVWARRALEIDPRFELAYINYGNALAALGRIQEAQAAFEKAGELAPKDPLPIYSLGVLAENQGKIEQALDLYKRCVALDERFENGYFNMAAMLANLKRFDEATAALNRLLEINPDARDAKQMLQQIENERATKPHG